MAEFSQYAQIYAPAGQFGVDNSPASYIAARLEEKGIQHIRYPEGPFEKGDLGPDGCRVWFRQRKLSFEDPAMKEFFREEFERGEGNRGELDTVIDSFFEQ